MRSAAINSKRRVARAIMRNLIQRFAQRQRPATRVSFVYLGSTYHCGLFRGCCPFDEKSRRNPHIGVGQVPIVLFSAKDFKCRSKSVPCAS